MYRRISRRVIAEILDLILEELPFQSLYNCLHVNRQFRRQALRYFLRTVCLTVIPDRNQAFSCGICNRQTERGHKFHILRYLLQNLYLLNYTRRLYLFHYYDAFSVGLPYSTLLKLTEYMIGRWLKSTNLEFVEIKVTDQAGPGETIVPAVIRQLSAIAVRTDTPKVSIQFAQVHDDMKHPIISYLEWCPSIRQNLISLNITHGSSTGDYFFEFLSRCPNLPYLGLLPSRAVEAFLQVPPFGRWGPREIFGMIPVASLEEIRAQFGSLPQSVRRLEIDQRHGRWSELTRSSWDAVCELENLRWLMVRCTMKEQQWNENRTEFDFQSTDLWKLDYRPFLTEEKVSWKLLLKPLLQTCTSLVDLNISFQCSDTTAAEIVRTVLDLELHLTRWVLRLLAPEEVFPFQMALRNNAEVFAENCRNHPSLSNLTISFLNTEDIFALEHWVIIARACPNLSLAVVIFENGNFEGPVRVRPECMTSIVHPDPEHRGWIINMHEARVHHNPEQ